MVKRIQTANDCHPKVRALVCDLASLGGYEEKEGDQESEHEMGVGTRRLGRY